MRRTPIHAVGLLGVLLLLSGGLIMLDGAAGARTPQERSTAARPARPDTVFCNSGPVLIPLSGTIGAAGPYPSVITVSGLSGVVSSVVVTLTNLTHTYPDDIDALLVGPGGQNVMLMSD